ncbi:amidohydrolase family protein [Bullifex sp.]|uniref:amidohydrolase family protein n=1 Tax=Bullifex sp. TaxID=2815808 RepID=UPI002A7FE757|nr:amidohydrolase family protein [Bullifex sp.]MDY4066525.1 amidohydrolase family protein [Bullifex sp.]
MNPFFDIHFHVMTFKEPNLAAFFSSLDTSAASFLQGNITKDYIITLNSIFKGQFLSQVENTLTAFSRPIDETFKMMEDDLKGKYRRESNKADYPSVPYLRDKKLYFRDQVYDRIFLSPLLMDFSQTQSTIDKLYYSFTAFDKITPYALDTISAINKYYENDEGIFEFYPFIGINPSAHSFEFLVNHLNRFVDITHNIHPSHKLNDKERIFFGVKLYPPLGFDPWPQDSQELKKVRYLYDFCSKNRVPIITHCDDQGFKGIDPTQARKFTDPATWKTVLENYPSLIIDFAHVGREYAINSKIGLLDNVQARIKKLPTGEWFYTLMDMIKEYDNVYTDISFTGCYKDFYITFLNYLDLLNENDRERIESRILFGSDFSVNLLRVESYLNYYHIFDSSPFSDELIHKMVSINPMNFLGLKEVKKPKLPFFSKRLT